MCEKVNNNQSKLKRKSQIDFSEHYIIILKHDTSDNQLSNRMGNLLDDDKKRSEESIWE